MKLEILICTIDNRIERACDVLMSPQNDISYLISWQQTEKNKTAEIPEALRREDVRVITLEGKGLSRNRNNAINNAKGDICLIADDDLKYEEKDVRRIFDVFSEHPTLDLATFKYRSKCDVRKYPSYSFDLRQAPHGYSTVSFEIAFRRTSIQGKLGFNEKMGLGAPFLGSGEEEVFILDAINLGLNCKFFPIDIVTHDNFSTFNSRIGDESVLRARGMLLRIYNPYLWFPHYFVAAYRVSRASDTGFFKAMRCMFEGYKYARENEMINYNKKR